MNLDKHISNDIEKYIKHSYKDIIYSNDIDIDLSYIPSSYPCEIKYYITKFHDEYIDSKFNNLEDKDDKHIYIDKKYICKGNPFINYNSTMGLIGDSYSKYKSNENYMKLIRRYKSNFTYKRHVIKTCDDEYEVIKISVNYDKPIKYLLEEENRIYKQVYTKNKHSNTRKFRKTTSDDETSDDETIVTKEVWVDNRNHLRNKSKKRSIDRLRERHDKYLNFY